MISGWSSMNLVPRITPHETVFARMLYGPPSCAHERVSTLRPPFEIAYGASMPPPPTSAAKLDTLTIAPPPASRISGITARQRYHGPDRFTRRHQSQSAGS